MNQCLDPNMSHIISGSFSPFCMRMYSCINILLGWMEKSVEFSVIVFFFLLEWEWGKRAKGGLLQDSEGNWKGSVGFAELREASGSSSLGVEKFPPHPFLISESLHLLSGCGSSPICNYSNSLSTFLGPFCSHSSCLPSAVPCLALFRLWYPGFVGEPGEEPAEAVLCGAVVNYCSPCHPTVTWLGLLCGKAVVHVCSSRETRAVFTLKRALLLPLPSSAPDLFCLKLFLPSSQWCPRCYT